MRALMIVDLQHAFSLPPHLVEHIRRYSRRFRRRVFTRFINRPGSLFRRKLKQGCCAPDSADTSLQIAPSEGDLVINKTGYGLRPRDITRLRNHGIDEVIVCGVDTDACVLGVMFSLFDAGFECSVKKNLCWSSSGLHQEALKIIEQQFHPPR